MRLCVFLQFFLLVAKDLRLLSFDSNKLLTKFFFGLLKSSKKESVLGQPARRRQKLQSTSIRKYFRYELGKLSFTTCPSLRNCETKAGLLYDEAKTFRSLQFFPETLRFSEIA